MVASNNSINNTVGGSDPALTNTLTVQNTGTGAATVNMQAGGTSGGNIWTQYTVGTRRSYAMGVAQNGTATPSFVISTNNSGTVDPTSGIKPWSMNTNGGLTLTTQPCFMGFLNQPLPPTTGMGVWPSPVTGEGTIFQIGSTPGTAYTADFDLGHNLNLSTGVFTAPIAGIYWLEANCIPTNLTQTETLAQLEIANFPPSGVFPFPPSEQWQLGLFSPSNGGTGTAFSGIGIEACGDSCPVNHTFQVTLQCIGYHDMAAGDQAAAYIMVAGGQHPPGYGAKYVALLSNGGDHLTYFAGVLVA